MARNTGRRGSGRGGATNGRTRNGTRKSGARGAREGAQDNAKLYRDLCDLVRRNPSNSEAGMRQRRAGLRTISARLAAIGFRGLSPRSLGGRHVAALVEDWKAAGCRRGR